jgi:hypothetical protein
MGKCIVCNEKDATHCFVCADRMANIKNNVSYKKGAKEELVFLLEELDGCCSLKVAMDYLKKRLKELD